MKLLRFLVNNCQEMMSIAKMSIQQHSNGAFVNRVRHHYTHRANLMVMMGVVGLTGVGGLGMMGHQLRNPEVTLYREHPQTWDLNGGNFRRD